MPRARGTEAPSRIEPAGIVDNDLNIRSGSEIIVQRGEPGLCGSLRRMRDGDEMKEWIRQSKAD